MSLDPPVIETPYKDANPTFDVSNYLANGCEPFAPGSVMATIDRNHIFWDVRISTAGATNNPNRRFFDGLPVEFRPPVGVIRAATHGLDHIIIQWHTSGWVFLADAARNLTSGVIAFEARTIRRPL